MLTKNKKLHRAPSARQLVNGKCPSILTTQILNRQCPSILTAQILSSQCPSILPTQVLKPQCPSILTTQKKLLYEFRHRVIDIDLRELTRKCSNVSAPVDLLCQSAVELS